MDKVPQNEPPCIIQTAIRCNLDEYYFTIPIIFFVLFIAQNGPISLDEAKEIKLSNQGNVTVGNVNQKYQNENSVKLLNKFIIIFIFILDD